MMMVCRKLTVAYIVLYISTLLASYTVSTSSILKRTRKEDSKKHCKQKRYDPDITRSIKYSSMQVSKNEKCKEYIGNKKIDLKHSIIENHTEENGKSFISSERQFCSACSKHSKNKEAVSSVNRVEITKEDDVIVLNEIGGTPDYESMCCKDLVITTDSHEIKHHYENPVQQQYDNNTVYSYPNSKFLDEFLHSPSPSFTADSIRVRFGSGFLHFLSSEQLIRVLVVLLSRDLRLKKAERSELVETIFGHIDFSLEMNFNNEQVVSIVTALLMSDIPHCFEQVFLTWKMWKVFTMKEQEKMLEGIIYNIDQMDEIRKGYERETVVMLYLFVLNRDTDNSYMCEIFKESIIKSFGEIRVLYDGDISKALKYIKWHLFTADKLDTSLLDLPNILNSSSLAEIKEFVKTHLSSKRRYLSSAYPSKKYEIHLCYALTKFTRVRAQNDNESVADIYSKFYFDPKYIRSIFVKWYSILRDYPVEQCAVNEFRTAYGAIRQIIQSTGYDSVAFIRLFYTMDIDKPIGSIVAIILFSLTKEDILREVNKMPEWAEYIKNRSEKNYTSVYIENIFMCNADLCLNMKEEYCPDKYVKNVTTILSTLINSKEVMYREYYLYQQLLFHPKFKIFNNLMMQPYIQSLSKIGQLKNEERCVQIVRDLVFSEYYYQSVVALKLQLLKAKGNMKKFRMCIENELEYYKNEADIEKEREALKNC